MNPERRWLFNDEQRWRTMRLSSWVLPAMILAMLWLPARSAAAKFTIPSPEVAAAAPGADLRGIGSDGADGVWFNDVEVDHNQTEGYMAHYSPGTPELTRINIQVTPPDIYQVFGVAPGLNGDEWFTRLYRSQVSRIAADGTLSDFALDSGQTPEGVVVDPSGNVWITIRGGGKGQALDRLSPDGELRECSGGGESFDVTIGPDGNLWVPDFTGGVSEISAECNGVARNYPLANPGGEYVQDVASLSGRVWATVGGSSPHIAAISPSGSVHNYNLHNIQPQEITAGPDDAVWFIGYVTHSGKAVIGRLSSSGSLSKLMLGDRHWMADIAATPDAVYLTQDDPAQDNRDSALMRIPVAPAPQQTYVALGDSYSSGEGAPPYESASDLKDWDECHRSKSAYSRLLDQALNLGQLAFWACSGATTNDLFTTNASNHEPEQLVWLELNPDATTVTLTIGGDDIGFREVLEHCVEGYNPHDSWPWQGPECSTNQQLRELVANRLKVLEGSLDPSALSGPPIHPLRSVFAALHADAPSARIVVGGYPKLFGAKSSKYQLPPPFTLRKCEVGSLIGLPYWIQYQDAQWLNQEGEHLDSIIQAAAVAATQAGIPVKYAPPAAFKGHGLCDAKTAWINGLMFDGLEVDHGSFHPTTIGQASGYEPAFAEALK